MDKEFYEEKVQNFCSSNTTVTFVVNTPVLHDVQSALAMRLASHSAKNLDSADIIRCAFDGEKLYVDGLDSAEKDFFEARLGIIGSVDVASLTIAENKLNDEYLLPYALNTLSYDGLCAFMALCPADKLVSIPHDVSRQIMKNFNAEVAATNTGANDGAEKIAEIGEKYSELQSCYISICDEYQKEQIALREEAKRASEAEHFNRIASAGKYMEMEDELMRTSDDMIKYAQDAQEQ